MKRVFIINGGQEFEDDDGGQFNMSVVQWEREYFESKGLEVKVSHTAKEYYAKGEADKMMWADLIIYHVPVWWFQVPYDMKEYIDEVLQAGRKMLYQNDGRQRDFEPKLHYGTGGLMDGKAYMITTSWNAPKESFSVEGEFFYGMSADDVFIGLHKMNEFMSLKRLESFHFYDMQKDVSFKKFKALNESYLAHLAKIIAKK